MNKNETPSWLAIVVSVFGLIALTWAGVKEKYPEGMGGAIAAIREPVVTAGQLTEEPEQLPAAEVHQSEQSFAKFTLKITGNEAVIDANLPKGSSDKAIWNVLRQHFEEPLLDYTLAFEGTSEPEAWVEKLPPILDSVLSHPRSSQQSLNLNISPETVEISGQINSQQEKQAILGAVESLFLDGRQVINGLTVLAPDLENPSLKAVAQGNLLELSGRLPLKYEQSELTENLKLAMSAGFVDNTIEYTDVVADSKELEGFGEKLQVLPEYGDNPTVIFEGGKLQISLENSDANRMNSLATQLKDSFVGASLEVEAVEGEAEGSIQKTVEAPPMTPVSVDSQAIDIDQTPRLLEVNFAYNSFELLPGSLGVLDRLVLRMDEDPELDLVIEGHTDSTGNPDANLYLSQMRANAVKGYLIDSGISEGRLKAVGMGDVKPIASNGTRSGRSKNRRIEIRKGRS